jgi:DNA polymerase II large subunit
MEIEEYFSALENEAKRIYEIARAARRTGLDVSSEVEIPLAKDLATRVEGLVGPAGVADLIREYSQKNHRERVALMVMKDIIEGKLGRFKTDEERAEQCIRTSLTILTEGVTAAGTEGISRVAINSNSDGSRYLSIFFAGPIRSAGGTAAAQAVVLTDYVQKLLGLQIYKPTETEIERYVEEIEIYHNSVTNLQYKPSDDEIRYIVRNCPVCIDGDPTEQIEVAVYKGLDRVKTDRIRSGICLVIGEGIAQKAAKILKFSRKHDIGWEWLEGLIKVEKKGSMEDEKTKPLDKYLGDIVGGRPIFAYPSRAGGFRLRYGRSRNSGIAAKSIHPACMFILDEFPAIGTQFKIERPGKGAAITPCDSIEPPVVRLKNGDVLAVNSPSKAVDLRDEIEEILFLGDILISYGDFSKTNHTLLPAGFCEEWWNLLAIKAGITVDAEKMSVDGLLELSEKNKIPLHPRYTYFYGDISKEELVSLVGWLKTGEVEKIDGLEGRIVPRLILSLAPEKRILEKMCVPHRVVEGKIIINEASALLKTLNFDEIIKLAPEKNSSLELINATAPFPVMDKSRTYIGARMGRPEKAKERLMSPAPHGLVPVGDYGGKTRSIVKAAERGSITLEIPKLQCPGCNQTIFGYKCEKCEQRVEALKTCIKCARNSKGEVCDYCGDKTLPYYKATINMRKVLDDASRKVRERPSPKLKGVIGTTNVNRFFEPLEKALLRAKHSVYVFKDGTIRFDATDAPLTHFRPSEIKTAVSKLRELGYEKDYLGNELKNDNQVVELKPHDILLAETGVEYFINTAKFIDDLLEKFYGLERFYNAQSKNDLVGHLVIGLAPHTSVGVLGRLIGFTGAHVGYAHPYFHTAKRRNCDGDEDTIMLLMDALVNFSKCYLPDKRGSTMDAPMVLNIKIDPSEVDDEVHEMETVSGYPLEFYEATLKRINPKDVDVETVQDRLGKKNDCIDLMFTHDTSAIDSGPKRSRYTQLKTMAEKVECELVLAEKLRTVDERDVAARVLNFHFLRDIYGNLRSFGQQRFRCVECNEKYRRVPLSGKCNKCGGKLLLTVNKGGIEKYLKISKDIAQKYGLSDYLKQRLGLVQKDLDLLFPQEKAQQSLADFM